PLARGLVQEILPVEVLDTDFLPVLGLVAQPDDAATRKDHVIADLAHHFIDAGADEYRRARAFEDFRRLVLQQVAVREHRLNRGLRRTGIYRSLQDFGGRPEQVEFVILPRRFAAVEVNQRPVTFAVARVNLVDQV